MQLNGQIWTCANGLTNKILRSGNTAISQSDKDDWIEVVCNRDGTQGLPIRVSTDDVPRAGGTKLGAAIHHVHGKDCYVDAYNVAVNGCNDHKPYDRIAERSWTFRTIGYGHDLKFWKDFVSALRLVGYDYVISIEHEDAMMSTEEGLAKALSTLKEAVITAAPGEMYWA